MKYREVFGIRFIDEPVEKCLQETANGGCLVVPSGPGLATMGKDPAYATAVRGARFAIADSGYLVLLLRLLRGTRLQRVSGLQYVDRLLSYPPFAQDASTLWVMPREEESAPAQAVLDARGVRYEPENFWIAPLYPRGPGPVQDEALRQLIEARRPGWVVLNIAGGIQEKLGFYLQETLSYQPTIVCTGAAIAFLSGMQARIPTWVDRLYLGWLARIIQSPRRYLLRYLGAFPLALKILRGE